MPPRAHRNLDTDIRVVIRNATGKYLAEDDNGLYLTDSRSGAKVLSLHADRVLEQLDELKRLHQIELQVDPVPLADIYELCDRCAELFVPTMIFFDGSRFLCSDCRRLAAVPSGSRDA